MTKGQVESKISEAICKFEIEQMGRGPEKIKTTIIQDMIIVRIQGFLSISEKNLASSKEGIELIKKVRSALFESALLDFKRIIQSFINNDIISVHSDVSTVSGEKLIVIVTNQEIDVTSKIS